MACKCNCEQFLGLQTLASAEQRRIELQHVREEFARFPGDVGSSEVQGLISPSATAPASGFQDRKCVCVCVCMRPAERRVEGGVGGGLAGWLRRRDSNSIKRLLPLSCSCSVDEKGGAPCRASKCA